MALRAMHLSRALGSRLRWGPSTLQKAPSASLVASRLVGTIPRARAVLRTQAPLFRGRKLFVRVSAGSVLGVRATAPQMSTALR
jgi:hypothetical protein